MVSHCNDGEINADNTDRQTNRHTYIEKCRERERGGGGRDGRRRENERDS